MTTSDTTPDASDTSAAILPGEHLHALRSALHGPVILPGDPEWDDARRAWQLLVDQYPVAVVVPADVDDVVATVLAARKHGLRVAPQSTGHAAGTIDSLADTILLRTSALDSVEIRPATASARVGAGVSLGTVADAAAQHGLAVVAGMAPSVGAVGFALGGGLGWLARSHGLAANSILALEAVDAHGRVLRIDETHHADLFWAARGGVAPVIVTAIEIRLFPVTEVSAGALMWPLERAADVAHAWREWIDGIPESVTSLARVLRYPAIPEIPEFLRGRSVVAVEAAVQADAATADALLAPLRALAPEIDTIHPMSPAELGAVHGDPPQPAPARGEAILLSEISAASVDAFMDAALAPSSAPLLSIELRHLGGALRAGSGTGGAVSTIDGEGLVFAVGIVPVPEAHEPVRAAALEVVHRLRPHAAPRLVRNFAERPVAASDLYDEPTLARLRDIAAAWDPDRVIHVGHPLG
ncbi:MAG: oxidoreductase [Microbacterium sp.]|nr:oxidoreductase [Microbacterium sp.]